MQGNLLILNIQAPFASWRSFSTGRAQGVLPVIPPSAAFGLFLNLAGIEMKAGVLEKMKGNTYFCHPNRDDLPHLEVATGTCSDMSSGELIHHMHGYVQTVSKGTLGGKKQKEYEDSFHGRKFSIFLGRRKYLNGYNGLVACRNNPEIISKIRHNLEHGTDDVPFAGSTNLTFDVIREVDNQECHWYVKSETARSIPLTISVHRSKKDTSVRRLFTRSGNATKSPPENAWTKPYSTSEL